MPPDTCQWVEITSATAQGSPINSVVTQDTIRPIAATSVLLRLLWPK